MVDQAAAPPTVTVWQIELTPAPGQRDRWAEELQAEAADIGLVENLQVSCARGFLLQGDLTSEQVVEIADQLLTEPVVEKSSISSNETEDEA